MAERPSRRSMWAGFVILALHLVGAVVWWSMLPGGFPVSHSRFWANRALPMSIAALVLAAGVAWRRQAFRTWHSVLTLFPVLWIACGIAVPLVFPVSGRWGWGLVIWGLWLISWVWRCRPRPWAPRAPALLAVLLTAVAGVAIPFSQRAPAPSTLPSEIALPEWPTTEDEHAPEVPFALENWAQVLPSEPAIRIPLEGGSLTIQPLLTFISRSPDRCWSVLASRQDREGPRRRLIGGSKDHAAARLAYRSEGSSFLTIHTDHAGGEIQVDAFSQLEQPVYSHLNSFCDVDVAGFQELSLSFSPCPDARIEVTVSDYPVGRPARMAFLDADGLFQVVEATSGEKGPYHRLASGPMQRSDSLTIGLHDGNRVLCRITLDDWARQASTDLSPTAGWGVPMNAFEFSRFDSKQSGQAALWITLAGTSVGRGWDTVGHSAGIYRNRLRVSR